MRPRHCELRYLAWMIALVWPSVIDASEAAELPKTVTAVLVRPEASTWGRVPRERGVSRGPSQRRLRRSSTSIARLRGNS